ncbi:HEXXH motif-containing protein [Xanthomonas sp. F14]
MLKELSNPMVGDYMSLYGYVADKLFYALLDKLEEEGGARISKGIDRRPLMGKGWLPPVGFVRLSWQAEPIWADIQMAIISHAAGLISEFDAELPSGNQPLMLGGRALPPCRYRIKASPDSVIVRSKESGDFVFRRTDHGHYLMSSGDMVELLGSYALVHSQGEWLQYKEPLETMWPLTEDRAGSIEAVDGVLTTLRDSVPEYLLWVLLPIKEITLLHPTDPRKTQSRSSSIFPGNIQITAPSTLPRLLAQLVHECSHQYFHLGQWVGPVTVANAPTAYSILKNTHRPLDRVLLGYHAFANIYAALMLLRTRTGDMHGSVLDQEIEHAKTSAHQLGSELDSRLEYLTEIGQDLYLPLRTTVFELESA